MPSGTPGLRALTGGLLMVMTAISFSFVSWTSSFIRSSFLGRLFLHRSCGDPAGIDHHRGDSLAMKRRVSKRRFRGLRAAVVQVKIVFPSETHAAVNLDAAIADGPGGVAAVHLGDGNGNRR